MFRQARIQLTAWYLAVIMAISIAFSCAIYYGVDRELRKIESYQKSKIQGILRWFPASVDVIIADTSAITEARIRIITSLGLINLFIFVFSGLGGYFLAGLTLDPIAQNMADQKDFISNASHELRTPLTSLKTEIEVALMDKKMTVSDARRLLRSNLEDVERINKLANYLLKMNGYEFKGGIRLSKIDLKEVALAAIGKRKIKASLESSYVEGNFDSLVELTTILLDNAYKYGEGKPVEIRVADKKLSVIDHGMGIAAEDLPHIFERFYRSDKSRGTEGYGLGLSIAKSIAEANKGVIKVKSLQGKGSVFTLVL